MTAKRNFAGVIAPVLTPFDHEGAVDEDRFIEHCEWLLEDGCTALAPFGTTSEGNSVGIDERLELLDNSPGAHFRIRGELSSDGKPC